MGISRLDELEDPEAQLRRYADGAVCYDPETATTFLLTDESLELLDLLSELISRGNLDEVSLLDLVFSEIAPDFAPQSVDSNQVENVSQWIRLALRMRRDD